MTVGISFLSVRRNRPLLQQLQNFVLFLPPSEPSGQPPPCKASAEAATADRAAQTPAQPPSRAQSPLRHLQILRRRRPWQRSQPASTARASRQRAQQFGMIRPQQRPPVRPARQATFCVAASAFALTPSPAGPGQRQRLGRNPHRRRRDPRKRHHHRIGQIRRVRAFRILSITILPTVLIRCGHLRQLGHQLVPALSGSR